MKYPEIFKTVSIEMLSDGVVTTPHMEAEVGFNFDEEDQTVMLSIDEQWFCRHDLLELASILCRIAATMEPEDEDEE